MTSGMDKWVFIINLDGELHFSSRFEVSVIPGGLTIIYNPNGPHFFKI